MATEELRRYKLDCQQAENEWRERETALTRANQALTRHNRDFKEARIAAQRAEEEWERMHDALEQETPQAGRLEDLERQLEDAKATKETNMEMARDAATARERIDATQRERRDQQSEIERELSEVNAKLSKAQIRVNRVQTNRETALHEKNEACESLEIARLQMASYEQQREVLIQDIAAMAVEAEKVGERPHIPPGETVDSLGRKYERLQNEIQTQNQR